MPRPRTPLIDGNKKRCAKCGEVKVALNEFYGRRGKGDGVSGFDSWCIKCRNGYAMDAHRCKVAKRMTDAFKRKAKIRLDDMAREYNRRNPFKLDRTLMAWYFGEEVERRGLTAMRGA